MMFKHLVVLASITLSAATLAVAQTAEEPPTPPALEWLLTYNADFSFPVDTGENPTGRRVIFPVQGGKFHGPKLNGETLHLMLPEA